MADKAAATYAPGPVERVTAYLDVLDANQKYNQMGDVIHGYGSGDGVLKLTRSDLRELLVIVSEQRDEIQMVRESNVWLDIQAQTERERADRAERVGQVKADLAGLIG